MGYLDEAMSCSNPFQAAETPSSGGGLRSIRLNSPFNYMNEKLD